MSAEPPPLQLAPRDIEATMIATCSDHGLDVAITYAAPPPGTPLQQLIERVIVLPPGWLLRLGGLELMFDRSDRLCAVGLYHDFAALPDEPMEPLPLAPPIWLRFSSVDAAREVISVRAALGVRLDRRSRRLRVTVGERRPAALLALADGLAVGADQAGAIASLQVEGFHWDAPAQERRS